MAALAAAGCSTPAMKATPIWDSEYDKAEGPPEDRINLWPLFYYRKPAFSVLWPLFSATDEGHALVPFYEFQRERDELRLLTVHPALPAGVIRKPGYRRVFNVVDDQAEERFAVLPLYFESPGSLSIVPLLHKNPDGFWTPLVTRFTRNDESWVGALGPLFLRHRVGELTTWHGPWPLVARWSGPERTGYRAVPLVWYDRDGDDLLVNLAGALFHLRREGDRQSIHWIWPLGATGQQREQSWNRFVPLWYWSQEGERSVFASLPYVRLRDPDGSWQSWFGLVHRFQGADGTGHAALPFYWRRDGPGDDEALITLVGGYQRSGDREMRDLLGPVYWSTRDKDSEYRAVLWPLYRQWRDGSKHGIALLPFFHWSRRNDRWAFRTVLASFGERGSNESFWDVGLVLLRHENSPTRTKTQLLWRLAGYERSTSVEQTSLWLFPAFYWRSEPATREFFSLPLQFDVHQLDRAELARQAVARLERSRHAPEEESQIAHMTPHRSYGLLLNWIGFDQHTAVRARRDACGAVAVESTELRSGHIRPLWFVPIFKYEERAGGKSRTELLWRLYDSRSRILDDGRRYSRQRVLWRFFHRETLDGRTTVDLFPFVTYDRDTELFQWSFMGGLVGWHRKEEQRTLRLLYLPIQL